MMSDGGCDHNNKDIQGVLYWSGRCFRQIRSDLGKSFCTLVCLQR